MILSVIVILAVIAADIATKYAVALNLAEGEAVDVLPGVVELTHTHNSGAAFSMLADHPWVFIVFSTVAIIGILAYLFVKRPESRLMSVSLALIAGGGIGNMIERLAHGYVTDFINPTFVDFAVFNTADSCITVGCLLLIVWMIADTVNEARAKKSAAAKAGEASDAQGAAGIAGADNDAGKANGEDADAREPESADKANGGDADAREPESAGQANGGDGAENE